MDRYIKLGVFFWVLYLNNAIAEEAPIFDSGLLSIPRVDTPERIGQYQNAQFKQAPDGRWDLIQVSEAQRAYIDVISIQILESFPVQVHIKVLGNLPTPCNELGPIYQSFDGNRFEIAINVAPLQTIAPCIQVLEPFEITIPLDVYGLPAGRYEVAVNGKMANFELSVDNH